MSEVTRLLDAAAAGDCAAADQLLPLVYAELRRLAAARLGAEGAGHTLDATALVHEAYLRLVGPADAGGYSGRGHFLAAAAEAMRRVLVEHARSKSRLKRGGPTRRRLEMSDVAAAADESPDDLLDLDAALERLAADDAPAAQVVKLRLYAGLSRDEAADALGLSRATAYRHWSYARAWLRCELDNYS